MALQVVPSGPNHPTRVLRDLVVEAACRPSSGGHHHALLPDEALLVALRLAVVRGVRVDLIVPARSDQLWVGAAGQFFVDELLQQGVHVHLYQHGLLHVKAMTVDGVRHARHGQLRHPLVHLNFELNLISYDADLNGVLRFYQTKCIQDFERTRPVCLAGPRIFQQWGPSSPNCSVPLLVSARQRFQDAGVHSNSLHRGR